MQKHHGKERTSDARAGRYKRDFRCNGATKGATRDFRCKGATKRAISDARVQLRATKGAISDARAQLRAQ